NHTEPDPPSAEEAAALLNAAWVDPEWGLLLWLTMITGPRRGEVSARGCPGLRRFSAAGPMIIKLRYWCDCAR
ncbi:MAG TPA: hypothetical protein VF734_09295, partial [Pseudonocardiaceae bacterium]